MILFWLRGIYPGQFFVSWDERWMFETVTSSFSYKLTHFPSLTGSEIDLRHVANLRAFLSDLKILVQTLIRSRFPVLSWPIYNINSVAKYKLFWHCPLKLSSRIFIFNWKEKLKLLSCFFSLRTLMIRQLIKFQEFPPLTGSEINKRHVVNLHRLARVPSCLTWRLKYKL